MGSGKAHNPEKKRLSEIFEALNDIIGAEVSDEDQLQFLACLANRIRCPGQCDVVGRADHGWPTPQSRSPPLLDAMAIHEKQSLGVPDSGVKSRALVLVILRILMADGGWRHGNSSAIF